MNAHTPGPTTNQIDEVKFEQELRKRGFIENAWTVQNGVVTDRKGRSLDSIQSRSERQDVIEAIRAATNGGEYAVR